MFPEAIGGKEFRQPFGGGVDGGLPSFPSLPLENVDFQQGMADSSFKPRGCEEKPVPLYYSRRRCENLQFRQFSCREVLRNPFLSTSRSAAGYSEDKN